MMTKIMLCFLAVKVKKQEHWFNSHTDASGPHGGTVTVLGGWFLRMSFGDGIGSGSPVVWLNLQPFHFTPIHWFVHDRHTDTLAERKKMLRNGSAALAPCSSSLKAQPSSQKINRHGKELTTAGLRGPRVCSGVRMCSLLCSSMSVSDFDCQYYVCITFCIIFISILCTS